MPRPRIRVINPNSNEAVTRGIDDAISALRFADGPEIICSTLAEGPFGVETQQHVESVALPLRRLVESDNASDAFVIACYSDPGLHVCREGTVRPVFGIAECGVLTALARAERFAVSASEKTLPRMIEVGRALKDEDGANAIVMGCAGMARHRKPLEDALGIPVIDPTQAAVTMAIGAVQLGR